MFSAGQGNSYCAVLKESRETTLQNKPHQCELNADIQQHVKALGYEPLLYHLWTVCHLKIQI